MFSEMSVQLVDHMGDDLSVVNAARVSFAKKSYEMSGGDVSLIKYLASHGHWTPFAHTSICLRMKAPVPIRTQCFKHKSGFVENEESRRYISSEPEFFKPSFRKQAANKKQGSGDGFSFVDQEFLQIPYDRAIDQALAAYNDLLSHGVAEEQARFVLPQGAMVNWYWTGSLAAYSRFYKLRTDPHAQEEIQQLASLAGDLIQPLFPHSWEALTT
jgi:thymidylate synthase (FAD)